MNSQTKQSLRVYSKIIRGTARCSRDNVDDKSIRYNKFTLIWTSIVNFSQSNLNKINLGIRQVSKFWSVNYDGINNNKINKIVISYIVDILPAINSEKKITKSNSKESSSVKPKFLSWTVNFNETKERLSFVPPPPNFLKLFFTEMF